jgi:2-iminobutanoate/2-iminopropanoate deaminase
MKSILLSVLTWVFCLLYVACNHPSPSEPQPIKDKAQSKLAKEKWHWNDSAKQSLSAGYAQVLKVGNTLYLSGIPANDLTDQGVSDLYQSLEKSLQSFGASFEHVVKENLYTTDIEAMKSVNEVRKKFYKNDFPAATWVQISRLYEPQAKLEVDLIAVLPD